MTKRMRTKSNASDTELLPEYLEIPFKVPNGEFCIVLSTKYNPIWTDFFGADIPKKVLAKFGRKGYKPMFSPFPEYFQGQVIKVYIFFRYGKALTRAKSRIANRKRNKVRTFKIGPARYKTDEAGNVFTA